MGVQVFYRKWRPQTLADVVGQEQVTRTLLNALKSGRVSHAYLFCGPRGTGKTSSGRILAKAINCLNNGKGEPCNSCIMCKGITEGESLDVIEIDAASNTGVEDIRSLCEKVNYAPNQARYKVYIVDEVHMLSNSASNALLKTLEEPPPHVIFILATTETHKVLPTILSRCQRFDFRRLSQADVVTKLSRICSAEGIEIEPEGLKLVARSTTGSLRDAENLLEQLTAYYGSKIELKQVQSLLGISGDWRIRELAKHIVDNDVSSGLATINSINNDGLDLRQFNREFVEYLRELMLIKTGSEEAADLTADDLEEMKKLAKKASLPHILQAVKLFGQLDLGLHDYSTLPLELALVDCTLPVNEEKVPVVKPETATTPQPQPVKKVSRPAASAITEQPEKNPESLKKTEPVNKPEPVEAEQANRPKPDNELEYLRQNWRRAIEEAPADTHKSAALAIMRSAGVRPIAIENDTILLAFRYPYHKEQIEKPENQLVTGKILSNFLGHPCQIRCVSEDNHLLRAALKLGAQVTSVEEK